MIAVVFSTRPEIIKLSPVVRALVAGRKPFFIIHTGQHYSYKLDRIFVESLGLPEPKYQLAVGSATHGAQTAEIIRKFEQVVLEDRPDVVLALGDTNSVLAAAIVCSKFEGIKLGHVEAGLRSYDRRMPEEINRILTDHASDALFAPTPKSKRILLGEGIPEHKIWVTGNTIVDAVRENIVLARARSTILSDLILSPAGFLLVTLHRQENVDDGARLRRLVEAINAVSEELSLPVVCPLHPRTVKALERQTVAFARGSRVIDPVGYFDFLLLQQAARLIMTDSGGVQEEACILGRPCVTLRENTERPETVEVGANMLGGICYDSIRGAVETMMSRSGTWENPFGDGAAGQRIVGIAAELAGALAA